MEKNPNPVVKLEGEIMTNTQGINKIMQFYNEASKFRDTDVEVDCYDLEWLDGNLTALLNALEHRLKISNNVTMTADFDFLFQKFGVLFRNGWLKDEAFKIEDKQKTTIPCLCFDPLKEEDFCNYITGHLFSHRGMPTLDQGIRRRILNDLIEVYTNIYRHAQTREPFFVCGQYYPSLGYFIFTMVDLGVGFLKPINSFTNGKIITEKDAVEWALKGNSTSGEKLAGMGLQGIHEYMTGNKGILHIYSGNNFWGTDLVSTVWEGHRELQHHFQGSLLNLMFKYEA